MKKRFLCALGVILCGMGFAPWAEAVEEGDYTSEVLAIGVGARPLAMGGAFVGQASDATAAYWNPAGLALVDNVEITTIHATQSSIQTYDFLNVAFRTKNAGSYALSYIRLSVDDIPITGPDGPTVLSTTQDVEQVFLLSGGWKLGKKFLFGSTLKFIKHDVFTAQAIGFGADLGFLFKPIRQLGIGISARDFTGGSFVQWKNTPTNPTQKIAPNLKVGVSYVTELGKKYTTYGAKVPASTLSVNFDVDTLYSSKQLNKYHFGVEYWYRQFVALRGGFETFGFKFDKDSFAPSVGLGVWVFLFEIDYAFMNHELSPTHYLSTITRF